MGEESPDSCRAPVIQRARIRLREATGAKPMESGKIHPFCSFSSSLFSRKKMVSAWLLWGMGRMHLCMCILGFFFVFLKEFWCIFFPTGTSCFTVLGFTKHPPVHVLNSPSMHGYIWAKRQVGHRVHTCPLLDTKTDMGLNVSPLLSLSHTSSRGSHGSRRMANKLPDLYSWLESSELSVFQMQLLDLLQTEITEAQDKYSTFVRETKIWGSAFCPDLPRRRRRKCCLSCAETENCKSYRRTSLCCVNVVNRAGASMRVLFSYSTSWSVQHTAGITVTHSNCILVTNSCTFLLKVKQTPFSRSWTYSR